MKNLIIITTLIFACSAIGFSQRGERIKALKIAFITEELELTPTESQNFWPLYNELHGKMKAFREQDFHSRDLTNLTNEEAETILQTRFDAEQQRLDLKRAYFEKLKQVLPARKLVRLPKAEKQFKKELLKRMGEHRKRNRGRF